MSDNKQAFTCALCDEAIYVGEEYYDIPGVGKCCTSCIADCHYDEAEDEAYNAYIDFEYGCFLNPSHSILS